MGDEVGSNQPAGLDDVEPFSVKFRTERGLACTLDDMFFCKNCELLSEAGGNRVRLKGPLDVEEEIDSLFCSGCLEVVPAVEASLFGFRCAKCYTCPLCSSFLQTASVATQGESGEEKFFFSCGFCKWESIAAGIEANEASGLVLTCLKRERDDPLDRQAAVLADEMAALLITQPASKPQWAARAPSRAPSRPGNPAPEVVAETGGGGEEEGGEAAPTSGQRLRMPASQPRALPLLRPTRSLLRARCSRRCLDCARIITKPDPSPQSTRFRVNMAAPLLVPTIGFEPPPVWEEGKAAGVRLWVKNPRQAPALLWLSPLARPKDETKRPDAAVTFAAGGRSWVGGLPDLEAEWDEGGAGGVKIPQWVEEVGGVGGGIDLEELVAWRTQNVVALTAHVTPLPSLGPVKVALKMQVQYEEDKGPWWVQVDLALGAVHPPSETASESSL